MKKVRRHQIRITIPVDISTGDPHCCFRDALSDADRRDLLRTFDPVLGLELGKAPADATGEWESDPRIDALEPPEVCVSGVDVPVTVRGAGFLQINGQLPELSMAGEVVEMGCSAILVASGCPRGSRSAAWR